MCRIDDPLLSKVFRRVGIEDHATREKERTQPHSIQSSAVVSGPAVESWPGTLSRTRMVVRTPLNMLWISMIRSKCSEKELTLLYRSLSLPAYYSNRYRIFDWFDPWHPKKLEESSTIGFVYVLRSPQEATLSPALFEFRLYHYKIPSIWSFLNINPVGKMPWNSVILP